MPTLRKRTTHSRTAGSHRTATTVRVAAGVVHQYVKTLGLSPTDSVSLHAVVRRGMAVSALKRFQAAFNFPSQAEVQRLVQIADATLARRRRAGRLDPAESDRLLRMARIFDLATTTFDGDITEARGWLSRPQRVLGGAVPEELATSEIGAQEVERALLRIEHGVFA